LALKRQKVKGACFILHYQNNNVFQFFSVISYQLSVISYQLSVISYQLSVISYQLSRLFIQYVERQFLYRGFHINVFAHKNYEIQIITPRRATTRVAPTEWFVGATLVVAPVRLKFAERSHLFF
jgi:hypothetical protein